VNATIEDDKSDQLGIIVMDELHMLDDENRGYLIKLMIKKFLCLQRGTKGSCLQVLSSPG
jgi:superfamily II helicase